MANNTTLNTMTGGDVIADEDVSGVKYQLIKLVDGTAAGTGRIAGDATNGLDVDVTRIIPGTTATSLGKAEDAAHTSGDVGVFALGVANEAGATLTADADYTALATDTRGVQDVNMRQPQKWFEVDVPGVANAIYAAGDQFGTIITITGAARQSGGTGWINAIQYYDNDDVMGAIDIVFFDSTVTLAADNAVYALSDADGRKTLFVANVTFLMDQGAQRFGQLAGLSIPYICVGGTSLFAAIITRTTPTPTGGATGQHIRFALTRD